MKYMNGILFNKFCPFSTTVKNIGYNGATYHSSISCGDWCPHFEIVDGHKLMNDDDDEIKWNEKYVVITCSGFEKIIKLED